MKKEFKTMTYGTLPLRLDLSKGFLFKKGVPIKAVLDFDTGEVTFKISDEDLQMIKNIEENK